MKYLSRKFVLTILVIGLASFLPIAYTKLGVSEAISMMVLGILGSVGAAYGFVNIKGKAIDSAKDHDDANAA